MRNLKKILAMVLALVMSLSLMATAGAAQFPDVDDSNPYKTAIDVLDELKVFQGFEDGTFKPTDTLNRAQAAVLVYRIATGDVENKYLDNYTYMQQSKFNDLDGYNWAKGYINYCQNAGIVVGTSATTFNPGAPVTGYQLMVMLLRTLGYGKAGEFTDPKGWELQTAAIAEREGILKNVTGGDFGAPAPRQMVAEILFRGLLHDTVAYSALTPGGYTNSGETLGKRNLGLEDISGVVMANEWADLESDSVLAEGKTRLLVGEEVYNLDITSALTDVGELRHAYVQNGTKVLTSLEDAGGNTVKDSKDLERRGEGIKVDKLRGDVKLDENTEYFRNFGDATDFVSEWRLEWSVTFDTRKTGSNEGEKLFDSEYIDISKNETDLGVTRDTTVANKATYTKVIRRGTPISSKDIDVMRGIFSAADSLEGASSLGIDGYVFAGSNSDSAVDRNKDLSDEMTWRTFYKEYILNNELNIKDSDNGEWLKVIDNDGDGVAEYVFRTDFTMTTITDWSSKTEKWDFESEKDVKNGDIKLVEDTSELAVGDVILYTWIDGVCHVSKPEPIEMTVAKKGIDYKNETLTGTDETVYDWSGIERKADSLYDDVSYAVAGVTYDLYQDYFGFTRLYKESDGGLVLLTDGYFATDRRNDEFKAQIWNGEFNDVDVVGGADDFISDAVNKESGNVTIGNFTGNSDDEGTWKRLYRFNATYYDGTAFTEHSWIAPAETPIQAKVPNNDHYTYNTNIASYIMNADGAYSLSLARDHRENARTHYNSFAIDVTNYEVKAKDQVLWGIEAIDANDKITDTQRINTTTETVYYLVEGTGKDMEVTTWTGYNNAPSNYTVERAYAVTSYVADKDTWVNTLPYEVAEVVVIEATKTGVPSAYLGISLEQKLFGKEQIGLNGLGYHADGWGLDTVTMKPSSDDNSTLALQVGGTTWPDDWQDMMNFYYNDGGYARRIVENFDHYRIYAGKVVTSPYVEGRNYIQITKDGSTNATQKNSFFFPHDIDTAYTVNYDADKYLRTQYDVDYTHDFDIGDYVVYMVDGDGNVGFVVNVTDSTWVDRNDNEVIVPGLSELWTAINVDYTGKGTAAVEFFGQPLNMNGTGLTVSYKDAYNYQGKDALTIAGSDYDLILNNVVVKPGDIKLSETDITYYLTINGKTYTLTQQGPVLGFGNLVGIDNSKLEVKSNTTQATTAAPGAASIWVANANTLVTSLKALLKTDADYSRITSVIGCDANGDEITDATAFTADHIIVWLENDEGKKQYVKVEVIAEDETPTAMFNLDIPANVKVYLWSNEGAWDVNQRTELTKRVVSAADMFDAANGQPGTLMLIADSVGTFTIDGEKTGGFDSTNVVEFANGSQVAGRDYNIRGVSKGVACMQIPAITMDLKVTFDKDATAKPVDGEITNLDIWEAHTPMELSYARKSVNGDEITITLVNDDAMPTADDTAEDVIQYWFGIDSNGENTRPGSGLPQSTSKVKGYLTYEDLGNNSYKVTANGYNGSTVTDSVTVTFEVDQRTPVYVASFWGVANKNNIQISLYNAVTGEYVAEGDLPELDSATITVNGTSYSVSGSDKKTDKDGNEVDAISTIASGAGAITWDGSQIVAAGDAAYKIFFKNDSDTPKVIPAGSRATYGIGNWTTASGGTTKINLELGDLIIVAYHGTIG